MDVHAEFLQARHLPRENYLNGDEAPPWELAHKHLDAIRAFAGEIRQAYATQTFHRCAVKLTADDVAKAENLLAQAEYDLALAQWRRQHGRFALDVEHGLDPTRRTEAHMAAIAARPPEPVLRPTASELPLPTITYSHVSAVLEYLGAADQRRSHA